MASFSLEEFVGNGALRELLPTLVEEGWDDVPTLKMMSADDMEAHKLTQQQRDALEIRTYLHDRSLMQYADTLEASVHGLPELVNTSPAILSSRFGMKRGHVARFIDHTSACGVTLPPSLTLPARRRLSGSTMRSMDASSDNSSSRAFSVKNVPSPPPSIVGGNSTTSSTSSSEQSLDNRSPEARHDLSTFKANKVKQTPLATAPAPVFKGTVAAAPPEPRLCGFVKPPPVPDDVAALSVLEKITVQRVAPEYRPGVNPWGDGELKVPPPMKASDIWSSKPTIIFCIRRPGCVMCRAEAHQLYSRKPIFDALGVQLVAVLNELIDSEVRSFWPRFWGGMVLVDKNREFFKALGGGVLPKDSFIMGFVCNPVARANYKRAKATGIGNNLNGDGTIKGGLLIMRPGKGGAAYQFVERNFGDWAPLEEVLEVCAKLQTRTDTIVEESPIEYYMDRY